LARFCGGLAIGSGFTGLALSFRWLAWIRLLSLLGILTFARRLLLALGSLLSGLLALLNANPSSSGFAGWPCFHCGCRSSAGDSELLSRATSDS